MSRASCSNYHPEFVAYVTRRTLVDGSASTDEVLVLFKRRRDEFIALGENGTIRRVPVETFGSLRRELLVALSSPEDGCVGRKYQTLTSRYAVDVIVPTTPFSSRTTYDEYL